MREREAQMGKYATEWLQNSAGDTFVYLVYMIIKSRSSNRLVCKLPAAKVKELATGHEGNQCPS
jgi:hypothetical protein